MKIFYTIRANKPTANIEIGFKDILWLLMGREIEVMLQIPRYVEEQPNAMIFKQPLAYSLFNMSAPRAE